MTAFSELRVPTSRVAAGPGSSPLQPPHLDERRHRQQHAAQFRRRGICHQQHRLARGGAGTCTNYRVRANYSIRWTDGGLSKFSVLSPLTSVCGPTAPPVYANCDAMHKVFPHGVGRPGAVDHTTGTRVTTFYISNSIYSANTGRDADMDGIACEKA